ncbi:hypothetical protein [Actinoplanes friuliensis]|uniref:Uncharacterized protein n=1 Tax=Actinoplanes friuliensis DSM 7358 TaxID=1246995 RepID=U5VTP5_9ACTN|nr:hypothetical protein [Actinoplanes friuliensis]AGZ39031.1 hypothetical protein AFR_03710 [Actinoplanes friuliensis DSM 7358]
MAASRTKQVQLLLTPVDEQRIADRIRADFPDAVFLDQRGWVDPDVPPVRDSILECSSTAAIWDRSIFPALSGVRYPNGSIDGPTIGPVVQWLRSLERTPGVLSPGRWAASFSDTTPPAMRSFVNKLWKIAGQETSNEMVWQGKEDTLVKTFHVGHDAIRASREGTLALVGDPLLLPR